VSGTAIMKRKMTTVLIALALALAAGGAFGEAYLRNDRIVVEGKGNSLASVARDMADPEIFSFDPERNVALANRNLLIKGSLLIGSEEADGGAVSSVQLLEMNVSRCGVVRIEVASSLGEVGELHLRRTKLVAIHETDDKCSDPNLLIVRGKLLAHDSEISGNIECVVEPGASVQLFGSTLSYNQNAALTCELLEGQRLDVFNCVFIDNANYGIRLGSCPEPLEIRDSVFRGLAADVFNAGRGELILTDCDFRTVKFGSLSGKVIRKWSVIVRVPEPGLHIVAQSAKGNPQREVVRGPSDENGVCRLDLTEYVAFPPRAQEFIEGVNNVTPHHISVYDKDRKTLLYEIENFHVFMKGQRVRFR